MDGAETAIGATLAVTVGLIWLASKALDWHVKRRTDRRFQRTARKAARVRSGVFRDLAEAKARREAERREFEAKFAEIVANYDNRIPHQRSKEEGQ